MSRIHIKDSVIAFLEKSLAPAKQKEIEDHLSICETCRLFVQRFASAYFSNSIASSPEVNPYFYTRVLSRLENKSEEEYLPVSIIRSLRPVAVGLFFLTAITFSIFISNYIISTNQIKANTSSVNTTNEMTYEYYISNQDPIVDLIISNER